MAYDIFISYRRKGAGAGVAGELQAKLANRGYKVFLDVDDIGSGAFPVQIDNAIKECNDFLLILSSGTLDRCSDERDWVRQEIMLAEQYGKNIVGVSLPGFTMPTVDALPQPLRDLPQKQVFLWSHEYRNASIDKIEENLLSFERKNRRRRRTITWIIATVSTIVAVAAFRWAISLDSDPVNTEEDLQTMVVQKAMKSYSDYVQQGDSLLRSVPQPEKTEEFAAFVDGIVCYDSALALTRRFTDLAVDSVSLLGKLDSLNRLRKQRLETELSAIPVFLGVDNPEMARYRYENAKVLATEADQSKIEAMGRKMQ